MIDAAKLKEAIRANLHTLCREAFPAGKFRYGEWRVGNVAGDPGDSLGIRLVGGKAGLFIDRAGDEKGDFVKLLQSRFGFGYREVAHWIGRTLGVSFEIPEQPKEEAGEEKKDPETDARIDREGALAAQEERPPVLSPALLGRMAVAAHRLARNPELLFTVLGERSEVSLDAVRGCALEGDLGFEADYHYGKLRGPAALFAYRHGIKIRYRAWSNGKRPMVWEGKPAGECWRQSLLRCDHKLIYVAEGETDVLAGLSLGVEEESEDCLLVGLASATILPKPLPFASRSIIILSDPDTAGAGAAEKLAEVFSSVALQIGIVSLGAEVEGAVS
jgi:hypothetical protein